MKKARRRLIIRRGRGMAGSRPCRRLMAGYVAFFAISMLIFDAVILLSLLP